MKKLIFISMLLLMVSVVMQSCTFRSGQRNKGDTETIPKTGGNDNWVIVRQSGGIITDVYKLENTEASNMGWHSWTFEKDGDVVTISGDITAIQVKSQKEFVFSRYVEYHQPFDTLPYLTKLNIYLKQATIDKGLN